jgi:hypothetical protein
VRRATGIERSTLSSHYEESDPEGDSHSFEEFNSVSTASDSSVLEDGYINDSFRLDFTPDSTTLSTSSSGELISDSSGGGNDTVDATSISIDNTYGEKGAFERSSTIEYNEETPYQTNGTDVTRWTDNFAYTVTEISVDDVTGDDTDTSGSTGSGGSTGGDDGVGGFGGGGFGGGPGSDSGGDDSPGSDVYVYEDEEFRHEFSGSSEYTHDSEFFLTHINPTLSYSYENNSSATSADGSSSSASSGTFEGKPAHTDVEAFSSFEANSSYSEDGLYTDANQVDTLRLVFKEEISNTAALIDSSNSSAGTYSDSYQATTGVGEFSTEEVDTTIITSVLTVHGRTTTWEDWVGSETDDTDEGSDDDGAGDDGTGDDGTGDDTGDSSDDSDEDTRPEKGDLLVTLATTVTSIGSDNAQFTETTDFGSSGDGGTDSGDSNFSTNSGGEWDVTSFERIEYFEGGYVDIYNSIDGDSSGNSNVNTDGRFEGDYTGTSFDGSDYDTEVDSDYSSSGTTESESTIGGSTTLEYYEDQVLSASGTITQDTTTSGESEASFERRNEKTGQTNGQDWDTLGHSGDDFTDEFNSNEVTTWTSSLDAEGNYQLDEDVVRNNTFSGEHSQWDVGDDVIDDDSGNLGGSSGGGDVGAGSSDGTTGDGDNEGTVVGSYAYTNNDEGGGFAGDGYGSFGFAAQYRNTNGADNFAFTSFGEPIGGSDGEEGNGEGGAGGVSTDDDGDTTGGGDGDQTDDSDGDDAAGDGGTTGDSDTTGSNTGGHTGGIPSIPFFVRPSNLVTVTRTRIVRVPYQIETPSKHLSRLARESHYAISGHQEIGPGSDLNDVNIIDNGTLFNDGEAGWERLRKDAYNYIPPPESPPIAWTPECHHCPSLGLGLFEYLVPGSLGPKQVGQLVIRRATAKVASTAKVAPKVADLPWGNAGARQAARAIEAGETSITVASRSDASEVVWRMFSSRGFTNTTGRTGSDVRKILGSKAGTYHWDEALDAAGRVAGHGADNVHGALPHVQIHLETGELIRIFFPK